MKRRIVPLLGLLALTGSLLIPSASAVQRRASASSAEPFCESHAGMCPDTRTQKDYEGNYVGHDEPSVVFYSDRAGSGNSNE